MHDAKTPAGALLGVGPSPDRAEIRRAFRDAVRRGRPDLGGMSGEELGRLLAARDALLVDAPASARTARSAPAGPSPARGLHAHRFDGAPRQATGRLVDVYA